MVRARQKAYRVKPHIAQLVDGVDPHRFNALVDELEDEAIIAKLGLPTHVSHDSLKK